MNRKLQIAGGITAIALAALLAVGWIVLNGAPGQRWARARLVERLEQMTGGRAELGNFRWRLAHLDVEVEELTIYGRPRQSPAGAAAADEVPWLHADRLEARLDFYSLLRRQIGLQSLVIEKPVVHLVIYSDGSSNQPRPVGSASVAELFQLSIGHLEVRDGTVMVNERSLPLDARADAVKAQLASAGPEEYRGTVEAGNVTAHYRRLVQTGAGALRFRIRPEEAVIDSVTWSSGDSRLEASGKLTNYSNPELQLTYKAEVEVAQLAKLSELKHVRGGKVQVEGSAHYFNRRLSTSGKLAARDAEWVSGGVRVRNLNIGAEYVIGPEDASFPHVFASAFGGTVTGALEVKNWRSSNGATPRQVATARLHVENVRLQNAAASASSRQLPLDKLNLRGRTSGTVDVAWSGGPESAIARFDLMVVPPPGPEEATAQNARELPVAGSVHGSYLFAPARLEFDHLDLSGPSLQLSLAGNLGTTTANAHFELRSDHLNGLTPLITAVLPRLAGFDGVSGQGAFSGTLSGALQAPHIDGRLTLSNLVVPLRRIPGKTPEGNTARADVAELDAVALDSAAADLSYTPDELILSNTVLRAGGSEISGNLRASLSQGELNDSSDVYGRITLRDTYLEELQKLTHTHYPFSGVAGGILQIAGTWGEPRAAGQMRVQDAVLYGEALQSVDAVVLLAGSELVLERLAVSFDGAQASGRVAYNWKTEAFQLDLHGSGLELARLRRIQSARAALSGQVDFDLGGSGTLSEPSLGGNINVQSMALNGERLGGLKFEGATRGRTLHIQAISQFKTGVLSLQGDIGLHDDLPAQADLHIARLDVDALLSQMLKGNLTGHSSAAGVVHVEGPLRKPGLLAVRGSLDELAAEVQGIELSNRGPVEFSVEQKVLKLRQFHFAGDGTELTATGSAELAGRHLLRLQANGNADLSLLKVFSSRLESSGAVTFQVDVGGTAANPDMHGTARVQNGSVAYQELPNGLSELNGTLVFNQDRLEVQSLTGRSGGGEVALGGFLNIGPRLGLNLTMKGQGVRLRQPPGISSLLNLDLQLSGSAERYTLSGRVLVTRFGITPQFDLGYYIATLKRPSQPNALLPLSRLQLNLQVSSAPELEVETAAARLSGDVDLNIRGTAARPVLIGNVNATEGEVVFGGARYQVNHAEITFNNPLRVEPVFDAELVTRIREYEVTLNFYGPLDRLSTTYRSEPPLPTADIVGLLAFGQTRPETVQVTRPSLSFSQSESQAILEQAMNSALNDRVQRLFGVSRVRISPPETVGTQINPSARLTLERQVSRNMTVIYVTNVAQSSQQVIQMEYNVSPSVALVATRDQNGIVSFDVRIRQRKR